MDDNVRRVNVQLRFTDVLRTLYYFSDYDHYDYNDYFDHCYTFLKKKLFSDWNSKTAF